MSENSGKNSDPRLANLLPGGVPGNKGGTGRPKSEIRARCAGSFDERIKVAEEIIDNPDSSPSDRLRALDILAKYGGLSQVEVENTGDMTITVRRVGKGDK